jgi:hypothetical protein
MNSEPRVWKWMVPAMAMVVMAPLAMWVTMTAERNAWAWFGLCSYLAYGLMPVFGLQAWAAYQAYYRHLSVQDFIDKRNAMTTTAETRLFDYAHTMHPDAVRMLLMHRKLVWRIKETKMKDLVDWVLDADPRIHVGLVEYVLKNSSQYAMMPMSNRFSDKAFAFDPEHLVTDYQQYRAFHQLLVNRLMATESLGSQPGQWIEPWNPDLVGRNFGVLLEEEDVDEVMEVPRVEEANAKPKAIVSQPPAVDEVATDQEMAQIRELQEEHKRRFGTDVKQYLELKNNQSKKEK